MNSSATRTTLLRTIRTTSAPLAGLIVLGLTVIDPSSAGAQTITCNPANCRVQAGLTLPMTGDTSGTALRYHRWTYTNSAGNTVTLGTYDTAGSNYRSTIGFDANNFQMADMRTVTLTACQNNFTNPCVTSTQVVQIDAAPVPAIACDTGAACEVRAGLNVVLRGDASASRYRYHYWSWLNQSGSPVNQPIDAYNAGFVSQVTFNSSGFGGMMPAAEPITIRVTLVSCTNNYVANPPSGSCATNTQIVTIIPQPLPVITCPGGSCTVQIGRNFDLTGDSRASGLRYQRWTLPTPAGATSTFDYDTWDTNFQSVRNFDANNFTAAGTVNVTLQACSNGYSAGTCATRTQAITLTGAPAPTIECQESPTCTVPMGATLTLSGWSGASLFPYHQWVWTNSANQLTTIDNTQASSYGYRSNVDFNAAGYNGTTPISVRVDLWACTGTGRTGTCARFNRNITVTPIPQATVTCTPGSCQVQAGLTMPMFGDSRASQLRYHHWEWTTGAGTTFQVDRDTLGLGYQSYVDFAAQGFNAAVNRTVQFSACSTGYNVGTCSRVNLEVGVTAAPEANISCSSGPTCRVRAGDVIQLVGDASLAKFRYHDWTWRNSVGTTVNPQIDTYYLNFTSRPNFDSGGYQGTSPIEVTATLAACTDGWRTGSCVQRTQTVTIIPSPASVISCVPASCRVQAGQRIDLIGTSSIAGLRFHEWRWNLPSGSAISPIRRDTLGGQNNYNSRVTFVAEGFNDASTQVVTLVVCSGGYATVGSCITTTQNVVIEVAPVPTISCSSGAGCAVPAGGNIDLTADTAASKFRYQEWTWTNGANVAQRFQRDTYFGDFRSVQNFAANSWAGTAMVSVPVRMRACTNGYGSSGASAGSCVEATQNVAVTPVTQPSIACPLGNCSVTINNTIPLVGDSNTPWLPYHEWRYANAGGTALTERYYTYSYGTTNRTTFTFNATGFTGPATRTIELYACSDSYNTGTCRSVTQVININAAPLAALTCNPVNCYVQPGGTMPLTLDARGSSLRWHEYRWDTAAGVQTTRQNNSTGFVTSVTFDATGFPAGPTARTVTAVACDTGYNTGNCQTTTREVTIGAGSGPVITCASGAACAFESGSVFRLIGDTAAGDGTRYAYHQWRWRDPYNNLQTRNIDTNNTGFRSAIDVPTNNYQNTTNLVVPVELIACYTGYNNNSGCTSRTQNVTIVPAQLPTITCQNTGCRVQAGLTMLMIGDSGGSGLRYHNWRWRNSGEQLFTDNSDSFSFGGQTVTTFNANGWEGAGTEVVELRACSNGYPSGTCRSTFQTITIDPPPAPTITCATPSCTVQAGLAMDLVGDSSLAQFRFHQWVWTDYAGDPIVSNLDTSGSDYRSRPTMSASGFGNTAPQVVRASLVACTNGYNTGSCTRTTRDFTVLPAPLPTITCATTGCRVQAGNTIDLAGISNNAMLRYHTWVWREASGGFIYLNRDSFNADFQTTMTFNADGFQGADVRTVELRACSGWYLTGTCVIAQREVIIDPTPALTISCSSGATCEVTGGRAIDLIADGSVPQFRYMEWRWTLSSGSPTLRQVQTSRFSNRTRVQFSSVGFESTTASNVTVTVLACTAGYRVGSCIERAQVVRVNPAPGINITCATDPCRVQAGQSIQLVGTSSVAQLSFHEWTWLDSSGQRIINQPWQPGVFQNGFSSTVNFSANGFPTSGMRQAELIACTDGYQVGTCRRATMDIIVDAAPVATITCEQNPTCTITAGSQLLLHGDANPAAFPYQEWTWRDGAGAPVVLQAYRPVASYGYRWSTYFSTVGYNNTANDPVTVEYVACTSNYRTGSCVTATRVVTVRPAPAPTIVCLNSADCTAISGNTIDFTGDSSTSNLPYHRWVWYDQAGNTNVWQIYTAGQAMRSTYSFVPSFTSVAVRRMELMVCSSGYAYGTCATTVRDFSLQPTNPSSIVCDPVSCRGQVGETITLNGNSIPSQLRYHNWRWNDAMGAVVNTTFDTGVNYTSSVQFPIQGYPVAQDRTVELIACSTGFLMGTCRTVTQAIGIDAAAGPRISCSSGTTCTVRMGQAIDLTGDSNASQYRYHDWRWIDQNGGSQRRTLDSFGNGYRSTTQFSAVGYQGNSPITIMVELTSCSGGYRTGNCGTRIQPVVVNPVPGATLTCANPNCTVQAGLNFDMIADSRASSLRYHTWRWRDALGQLNELNRDGGSAFQTTQNFNASTWDRPDTATVELWSCSSGYRSGTCTLTTQAITIVDSPAPTIVCSSGATCRVQAGLTFQLTGDSSNSRFPYHSWRWINASGTAVNSFFDTNTSGYSSTVNFNGAPFQPTATLNITVELVSCNSGYRSGSCSTTTQVVQVVPAPAATITCSPATCRVQAGATIDLAGDSAPSRLRYHTWKWRTALGSITYNNIDTASTEYASLVSFTATDFQVGSTQTIELYACTTAWRSGTCTVTTRTLTIDAPAAPTISCLGGTCRVVAGATLELTGDSSATQFLYHDWRWTQPAGGNFVDQRQASSGAFRSTVGFNTDGYQISQDTTIRVELVTCNAGYRTGSCSSRTQDILVVAPPAPTITCASGARCRVQAGLSVGLVGNTAPSQLRYHTWRWSNQLGNPVVSNYDTFDNGYLSSTGFSANDFTRSTTVTVELTACSAWWNTGTCTQTRRPLTIDAAPAPRITCTTSDCSVPMGGNLTIFGDSNSSRLPYHQWYWPNSSGAVVSNTIYTANSDYVSSLSFSSRGFEGTQPVNVTAELWACTSGYRAGTCVLTTRTVRIVPLVTPTITCAAGTTCDVNVNSGINMLGDSSGAQLPYHEWRWRDVAGAEVINNTYTGNSNFRSTYTFTAAGFTTATTRLVELIACSDGYLSGTCIRGTLTLNIVVPPPVFILCDPATCGVQAGFSLTLTGDSSGTGYRFHRWTWNDVNNMAVTTDRNADGNSRSFPTFNATGFTAGTTRTVSLVACDTGFASGTCVNTTRTITIGPAPAPIITCASGATCTVPMGATLLLTGDSSDSLFRFHQWTWRNPDNGVVTRNNDTVNTGFVASEVFSADDYQGTTPINVTVELWACQGGYRSGSCASSTRTIVVTPVAAPAITCIPANCEVQMGQQITLRGNSLSSQLRYHTWRWRDSNAQFNIQNNDTGGTGYQDGITFNANGWSAPAVEPVELYACATGYRSATGAQTTCVRSTVNVNITAAPVPTIRCSTPQCTVVAGQTVDLTGDASNSQFRYHEWRWFNAAGVLVYTLRDSFNGNYTSTVRFSADRFQNTADLPVTAELTACTGAWGLNSCARATQVITVQPPPAPIITCVPANCRVQGGKALQLNGDSVAGRFQYHEWRWRNSAGNLVINQPNTGGVGFASAVSFSAVGFEVGSTRDVELIACNAWWNSGTCTRTTRTVTIDPPDTVSITCSTGAACAITAGSNINLTGDSSLTQLPYHEWNYEGVNGTLTYATYYTGGSAYRSVVTIPTHFYEPTQNTNLRTELIACSSGYRTGTCTRRTQNVTVTPAPLPTIRCLTAPNCDTYAGGFVDLTGNSLTSQLPYHEWKWFDHTGVLQIDRRYGGGTGYITTTRFSATYFRQAATRTVELLACSRGYRDGTCVTQTQVVTITPLLAPVITCDPVPCRVQSDRTMTLTGDGSGQALRYQEWRWTGPGNVQIVTRRDGGLSARTTVTFDPAGLTPPFDQNVELIACTTGYLAGFCATSVQPISIDNRINPTITCTPGSACRVLAGQTIQLFGDSIQSQMRYHSWRWRDFNGTLNQQSNQDTINQGYRSTVTFDSNYRNPTADTPVTIELAACDSTWFRGNCGTATINVIIVPVRPAVIGCTPSTCRVQAGLSIPLVGTSSVSELRYHTWIWRNATGDRQEFNYDTFLAAFRSNPSFNAGNFQAGTTTPVELWACSVAWRSGTCTVTTRTITVDPAPPLTISCASGATCTLPMGQTLQMFGDSSGSQFRYHEWGWRAAEGQLVRNQIDTVSTNYRSSVVYSSVPIQGTTPRTVQVELWACTGGWRVGTCTYGTRDLTVVPISNPTITCGRTDVCTVQIGQSLSMFGDSSASRLRYHEWRWLDASSNTVISPLDTVLYSYRSTATFDANEFQAGGTRVIQLTTCTSGYGVGTCTATTRTITVIGAPQPTITCLENANCRVQAGSALTLAGDSSGARFQFHRWIWPNEASALSYSNQNTINNGFRSSITFDASGFEPNTNQTVTVELITCTNNYAVGSCTRRTQNITITPEPQVTITCQVPYANCEIQAGLTIDLIGDSGPSELRFHEWRWNDYSGTEIVSRINTINQQFRSNVRFTATGWEGAGSRVVTLIACSENFLTGTCTTFSRTITIVPPVPVFITCEPGSCIITRGFNLTLFGDSTGSATPYHEWRWTDSAGAPQLRQLSNGGARNTTQTTFSAAGFAGPDTRVVTLTACTTGYGQGTCVTAMRTIQIDNAPPPRITCPGVANCSVQAGNFLDMLGDSIDSQYRYHDWRWAGPSGNFISTQRDTQGFNFNSIARLSADGYPGGGITEVTVDLAACTGGYRVGACVFATRVITVLPAPAPRITCDPSTCRVQAGLTMDLVGTATSSRFRYHRWTYLDATGSPQSADRDTGGTGWISAFNFNANGFRQTTTQEILLQVCTQGFNVGSCRSVTREITVFVAPEPTITCSSGAACRVIAGQVIQLFGNSSASGYRYHHWEWEDASGNIISTDRDTLQFGFASSADFSAIGFNNTVDQTVDVTLTACTDGYAFQGSCTSRRVTVTVQPAPGAVVTCTPPNCRVQAGLTMPLRGDASAAQLRYHRWRWQNATGITVPFTYDTVNFGYVSAPTFDADEFQGAATRTVDFAACSSGYGVGTCVTRSVPVTIDPAPQPAIACADSATCTTRAGLTMDLYGDSSSSQFRYHQWTWNNASGAPVTPINRDTASGGFRSTVTYSAADYPAGATAMVNVTLRACTRGYGVGSCTTRVQQITIGDTTPPVIACSTLNCSVQAGLTLIMTADTNQTGLPYHTWSWTNATNQPQPGTPNVDTRSTGFVSAQTFDASGFTMAETRTVEVRACATGFGQGTCVTARRDITVVTAQGPRFSCATGSSCRVVVGTTLQITGTTTISQFRFHSWRYLNSGNSQVTSDQTASAPGYATTITFNASGYPTGAETPVVIQLGTCSAGSGSGTCVTGTMTVTVVPDGPATITASNVTPRSQPERADYRFEAGRPATWTINLFRRVNNACTTDLISTRTASNLGVVTGTWSGLSPGQSYCWSVSTTPSGTGTMQSGFFDMPALPRFTAGPNAVVNGGSVTVTAEASVTGAGRALWLSGACTPTSVGFDGVNIVTIPGPVIPVNAFTWDGWINLNTVSDQTRRIFSYAGSVELGLTTGALQLTIRNSGGQQQLTTTATVASNRWVHLAATWSVNNPMRLYIDGLLRAQVATTGGNLNNDNSGLVLGATGNTGFIGQIASMAIHNTELSAATILARQGAGVNTELTVASAMTGRASYDFSEAPGVQSVYDTSGNGWAGVMGTTFLQEPADPQRSPAFTGSGAMNTGTMLTGMLTGLTGGPNYCYRVTSDTALGLIASNTGTFVRMVQDTVAPTVTVDPLTVAECTGMESTTLSLPAATAMDNQDPSPVVRPTVGGNVITFPYRFPLGETVVRWTATDASGNVGAANQTVRVRDLTNPTVTGGPVVSIEATDPTGTPYNAVPDSATDTCSMVTVTNNGPARYPLGDTVVTFTARDAAGNSRTGTRTVRVVDTTAPTFDPPLGTVTYLHNGSNCYTPTLFPPTVTDNGYANFQLVVTGNRTAGPGFPMCWDLGTHTVEWTVRDPDGNQRTGTQTVIVREGTASLEIRLVGLEVNGNAVQPGRYYNAPVTVITEVTMGNPPYVLRLTPEPTSQTVSGNRFRSVYDAPGDYSRIQAAAQDGNGNGANIGQAILTGFGIDTTPPVIDNFVLDQTGVTVGMTNTYPYMFIGEELSLESLRARDGLAVPDALVQAARFDGTDLITVPNPATGFFTDGNVTGALTVEAWVRFDAQRDRAVVSKAAQDGLSTAMTLGTTAGGAARFQLRVAGTLLTLTGGRLETNRWHHVAGRYDGRVVQLWVDAKPAAFRVAAGTVTVGTQPLVIGAEINGAAPSSLYTGDITDVALWRTAITETDLLVHFRGGVGRGIFPGAGAAGVWHMNGTGQEVTDASPRANHGRLGQTVQAEGDDPTRVALVQPVDPLSSGLVSVTARLQEVGQSASSMITTASTAMGTPLARGYRQFGGRVCNAPVGSVCNPGERTLTVSNIRMFSQQRLGAYHVDVVAADAAGNMAMRSIAFRTQDYAGALAQAIAAADTLLNDPLNAGATNELRNARESFNVARAYATMSPAYMDGSYLRADQGVQYLLDAQVLNVDIGRTAEYVSRAMAGNIRVYVNGLTRDVLPTDQIMWDDAQRYLLDARFELAAARYGQVDALVRTGMDSVALLYPSYQAARRFRRDARQRFDNQLAMYDPRFADNARTDSTRLSLAMQMTSATRDMLRDVLYREITAALTNPLTTQRSSLTELQDVLDKNSPTAADERGDLIAITSLAVSDACLDRLASFTLSDETFTRCYIRLNDLARTLDGVQEGLVYTYRWRAGVAIALFNMLEVSLYLSPTGLPWVTSGATLPQVRLVLPDTMATTVNGSVALSTVDVGGQLARAYAQYDIASQRLRDGNVNGAWNTFVAERCLLLNLYNRYYSTNRMPPNVGDDMMTMMADPVIDPMSVGCMP